MRFVNGWGHTIVDDHAELKQGERMCYNPHCRRVIKPNERFFTITKALYTPSNAVVYCTESCMRESGKTHRP